MMTKTIWEWWKESKSSFTWRLRGVEWVHGLFLFPIVFRENVVASCKIGSFLCSLDYLLQNNVIVLFFGNQISKWRSFEKRAIFDLLFTFFSHQGKVTKILSAYISLTYIHVFCSPYWLFFFFFFCLTNFEKKNTNLSDTVSLWYEPWCWFLFRFILEQSINNKMVSKIWNVYYWYVLTLMPNS